MTSIIIPAHNEGAVITRCLESILAESDAEVIVVCNGCSDDTAQHARSFGDKVKVIETDVASKANALNLGDEAASSFPRIYSDADIVFEKGTLQAIQDGLTGSTLAVSPTAHFDTSDSSIAVRMYYAAWTSLPFHNASTIGGSGVYAMNQTGRERFDQFPLIISDDGFVRLQFRANERKRLTNAYTVVRCPTQLRELIKMKTRVTAGKMELRNQFPETQKNEEMTIGMRAWSVLKKPHLWPCFVVYAYCKVLIRQRIREKDRSGELGIWDRDDSSRSTSKST